MCIPIAVFGTQMSEKRGVTWAERRGEDWTAAIQGAPEDSTGSSKAERKAVAGCAVNSKSNFDAIPVIWDGYS